MKRFTGKSAVGNAARLVLLLLGLCWAAAASGQDLKVLRAPQKVAFPNGYNIVNGQGKVLKELPNERSANIQAYADFGGERHYMSDWSYQRYRDKRVKPNWIRARAEAPALKTGIEASPQSIEALIDSGDYAQAKLLALKYVEKASKGIDRRILAEAHYYLGLSSFLAENDDAGAQRALEKSIATYSGLSPRDYTGEWKALYVTLKLYFDHKSQLPGAWGKIAQKLRPVEQAVRREQVGLGPEAGGQEIYKALLTNAELSLLRRETVALVASLRKALTTYKGHIENDLIKEHESRLKRLDEDITGQAFGRNPNLTRIKYYREGLKKLSEAKEVYLGLVRGFFLQERSALRRIIGNLENDKGVEGSVVGFSYDHKWAYEFLSVPTTTQISIESAEFRPVVATRDWIVSAAPSMGETGHQQTDLRLFDAKTLILKAHLRVPNKVISAGQMPGSDVLYFLTVTASKYLYDDVPLALVLADPVTGRLERVQLINPDPNTWGESSLDYWFALSSNISLSANGKVLNVDVDTAEELPGYRVQRSESVFEQIQIKVGIPKEDASRPRGEHSERLAQDIRKDEAGLIYLGQRHAKQSSRHVWNDAAEGVGFGFVGDEAEELHLVWPSADGFVSDLNLATLRSSGARLSGARPEQLGIFRNGTIYGAFDDRILLRSAKGITQFPLQQSAKVDEPLRESVSFTDSAAYVSLGDVPERLKQPARVVRSDGRSVGMKALEWPPEFEASYSINPSLCAVSVHAENNAVFSIHADADGGPLDGVYFTRYDLHSGKKLGAAFKTITGNPITGLGVIESGYAPEGYDAFSLVTWSGSSGAEFSTLLRDFATDQFVFLNSRQRKPAQPLVATKVDEKVFKVFHGGDGSARLATYEPFVAAGGESEDKGHVSGLDRATRASAKEILGEWKYSPALGRPVYVEEKDWVLIPEAFGYSVFDIGGRGRPEKKFALHLQGRAGFAIVLPDGTFAGSAGCEDGLLMPNGRGNLEASTLSPWRNRPAEVLRALDGDPVQAGILARVTERWLKKLGNPERKPEPKIGDVPTLTLADDVPLWARTEEFKIRFQVDAGSSPVKEVIVRVNGVDQRRVSNRVDNNGIVERTVTIGEGQNWIEAVAKDEKGYSSNVIRFRTILRKASKPARRLIIAMGVSKYRDASLNLTYAAKDAKDLADVLKSISPEGSSSLVLTDSEVTVDGLAQIRKFLSGATESDEVIAFCAGHGTLDSNLDYLYCGHDFDQRNPSGTGIKLDELVDAIGSGKALKRLLLLDTCHSGQVGEKEEMLLARLDTVLPAGVRAVRQRGMAVKPVVAGLTEERRQRFIEEMFRLPGFYRGLSIIGASGGAEFAYESARWNNGVFTASIIEALREKKADLNGDRSVRVSELRDYLAERVSTQTGGSQKPSVVAFERDQDFELVSSGAKRFWSADYQEAVVRNYYRAIQSKDELEVSRYLADEVDYYTSGTISKKKVMADIRGDWKRYHAFENYTILEFESTSLDTCQVLLRYNVQQGDTIRSGDLRLTVTLTSDETQSIKGIKAKVISTHSRPARLPRGR